MPRHKGLGVLVAFEGIDGAGKTTQATLLVSALQQAGESVVSSKEPTNGSWGKRIRDSALKERHSPREELKYFIRDREQHTANVIQPALDKDQIVVLDRYYYSTIAYQGVRGFPVVPLHKMMKDRFIIPDVVFLLDIDPRLSVYRISGRGDKPNEFEHIPNLEKAREIFLSIEDEAIVKIDGNMSIDYTHGFILDNFVNGPLKKRRCAKSYGCDDPLYCGYRMSDTCPWIKSAARIKNAMSVATSR